MSVIIDGSTGVKTNLGLAATPAVTNSASPDTGIYFPTSTTWAVATDGVKALYIDASQNVELSSNLSVQNNYGIGWGPSTATTTTYIDGSSDVDLLRFTTNSVERMRIDTDGNVIVGTTSQIASSKLSLNVGSTTATTYTSMGITAGSTLSMQGQSTSVSTTATTIITSGQSASLCLVYGSNGTNKFMDVILFGTSLATVNTISSLTVAGTAPTRTYTVTAGACKLTVASGTYTVQVSAFTMNG